MQHAEFRTPFSTAAVTPIVEMLTLYFPGDIDQGNVDATLTEFIQTIVDNAKGFLGYTSGWIAEEVEHERVEGKAKAYAGAIGWESLEAHMAYRETQTFKDDILKVRAIAKGTAVVSEKTVMITVRRSLILLVSCQIHQGLILAWMVVYFYSLHTKIYQKTCYYVLSNVDESILHILAMTESSDLRSF